MQITSGGKELLRTETFLALGLGETVIAIDNGAESLRFILDFVVNKDSKDDASISISAVNNKTLKATLVNWKQFFGGHTH